MAKSKYKGDYFNVIAIEGSDSADVLLYGIIGQDKWWADDPTEPITDLAIVQKLKELEAKYGRINVHINSPGGSMYHGLAIISALRNCKAEIHTYNDGVSASMASAIWMSGQHRHMAKNTLLMVHSPINGTWGNAKQLRSMADTMDKFADTIVGVMAEAGNMEEGEVRKRFFDNYEDHWLSARECAEMGLISEVEEYETESLVKDPKNMSLEDLMASFGSAGSGGHGGVLKALQSKVEAFFKQPLRVAAIDNHSTEEEMNLETIKAAIESGDVDKKALLEMLDAQERPAGEPEPEKSLEDIVAAAVKKAVKPLDEKIEAQAAEIKALGDRPGDGITKGPSSGDSYEEEDYETDDLEALNATLTTAAKNGEQLKVGGHGTGRKPKKK